MTNIGHYRAAGKLLDKVPAGALATTMWIAPPTRMDEHQLMDEGYYNIFGRSGARTEMPGCSLCMGNQARVKPGSTVLSTSTRNFPNRLGDGANVYLTSAELASVGAILGRIPTVEEYLEYAKSLDSMSSDIYRYMNFDQIEAFQKSAADGKRIAAQVIDVVSA
jgi:aconitate hydratase 2/2-methylisocitrate dehydratase